MRTVTPFLWFESQAEQAARFYVSVFPDSRIREITRFPEGGPGPAGGVWTVRFRAGGEEFTALNGGPHYKLNPAVSFYVRCRDQRTVDRYWRRLGAGGTILACGWLTDRFGVTWQIVPDALPRLLGSRDRGSVARVMAAMMEMSKLNIRQLEAAARRKGKS